MLALVLAGVGSATAGAQGELSVRGTVGRQTLDGVRPMPRELVTLHRVNARDAGPVDSAFTDGTGTFAFRVSRPDSQSMYLVSARFGGIAYFSSPMQVGLPVPPAEIVVYDTTSADVPLALQGRHLVISSPDAAGVRNVIDVLEIENDSIFTRVAGEANRPTFSVLVPAGATNVRTSQGEVGQGALVMRDDRAELYAPLSPGLRQVVLTYDLPAAVFPIRLAMERPVGVLEVLLEETGAVVEGGGVIDQGGVTVDGKVFTRYLGQDASAEALLRIAVVGGGARAVAPPWLLPLVLTGLTLGAILLFARRSRLAIPRAGITAPPARGDAMPTPASARPPVDRVTRLARQLAAVDTLLEGMGTGDDGAPGVGEGTGAAPRVTSDTASANSANSASSARRRDVLRSYRASLKDDLVRALADRTRVS